MKVKEEKLACQEGEISLVKVKETDFRRIWVFSMSTEGLIKTLLEPV